MKSKRGRLLAVLHSPKVVCSIEIPGEAQKIWQLTNDTERDRADSNEGRRITALHPERFRLSAIGTGSNELVEGQE